MLFIYIYILKCHKDTNKFYYALKLRKVEVRLGFKNSLNYWMTQSRAAPHTHSFIHYSALPAMVIENIEKRIKISTATCKASFEKAPLSNEGLIMIIFSKRQCTKFYSDNVQKSSISKTMYNNLPLDVYKKLGTKFS